MYLLLNNKERIVVDTAQQLEKFQLNKYTVYSLVPVEASELINDGEIRDVICCILKGNQMTKNDLIEMVIRNIDVAKSRVSKIITKMKKEKLIYDVDDWNYLGERFIGMS